MTLSYLETANYGAREDFVEPSVERISIWQLPKIVWAALAMLFLNLAIGAAFWFNPETSTEVYRSDTETIEKAVNKPSPFERTIDVFRPQVRVPPKLYPATVITEPAYAEPVQ